MEYTDRDPEAVSAGKDDHPCGDDECYLCEVYLLDFGKKLKGSPAINWQRLKDQRKVKLSKIASQIDFPKIMPNSRNAYHLFTIWVDKKNRDQILHELNDHSIGVAVNYRAIHLLKYFQKRFGYKKGVYPVAEKIGDSTISLPFFPSISETELDYVIETIRKII